ELVALLAPGGIIAVQEWIAGIVHHGEISSRADFIQGMHYFNTELWSQESRSGGLISHDAPFTIILRFHVDAASSCDVYPGLVCVDLRRIRDSRFPESHLHDLRHAAALWASSR